VHVPAVEQQPVERQERKPCRPVGGDVLGSLFLGRPAFGSTGPDSRRLVAAPDG
jgi:hypothetical protein